MAYGIATGDWYLGSLLILGSVVFVTDSFGGLKNVFARDLAYRTPTIAQGLCFTLSVAVKICLAALGFGALGLVIGDVVLSVAFGIAMLALVPAGRGFAFDRELARRQLSFGIPSQLSGLLASSTTRVQQLIVAAVLGTRELGFFYLAMRLPEQIYQLGRSFTGALLPAFSRSSDDQLERGFSYAVKLSAFVVLLPLAIVIPLAKPLVTLLFGDSWGPSATPFALLFAAMAVRFVFWHVGNLLKSRERVREITLLLAVQLATTAALSYAGAVIAGLTGVAVAALVAELVFVAPKIRLIRSVIAFNPFEVLKAPLTALALGVALSTLAAVALPPLAALMVAAPGVLLVFALTVWRSDSPLVKAVLGSVRAGPPSARVQPRY